MHGRVAIRTRYKYIGRDGWTAPINGSNQDRNYIANN
jgi:hypothetical protein